MLFSIVKQSARTSMQSIFQYALKDSKSAADIMALNRFGVNGLGTQLTSIRTIARQTLVR